MQKQQCSVVVLGASGRVGRLILAEWAAHPPSGMEIRCQRRQTAAPGISWELAQGSAALARAIGKADVLLVLSGVTPGSAAGFEDNGSLALAALQAGAMVGARHLFIASSAAVYGPAADPISETAEPAPLSDYGHAKLAMERTCTDWLAKARSPRPGVTFLRIGNVAGTDLFFRNLAKATVDEPLRLDRFADGSGPVRSYIGPATLARLFACLIHRAHQRAALPRLLNVGAPGGGVDMADFAPALAALGHPAPVIRAPASATALPALRLSLERLLQLCPIDPAEGTAQAMVAQWLALRGAA